MIKVAICDDEIESIQNIENKIHHFFVLKNLPHSISKFLNGEMLLDYMENKKEHFDIIFLDIKMNRLSGMDVAKHIRHEKQKNVFIVFVTALKEFVFDAFEVYASNYLVKPIDGKKLNTTLEKIIAEIIPVADNYLILHSGNQVTKIPFDEILYCEVVNHHIFIYGKDFSHEYFGKIEDLEHNLNQSFFRCHRSYIVNLKHINSYKDSAAYLPSGEKIPIAIRRQGAFMKALLCFQRKEVR